VAERAGSHAHGHIERLGARLRGDVLAEVDLPLHPLGERSLIVTSTNASKRYSMPS